MEPLEFFRTVRAEPTTIIAIVGLVLSLALSVTQMLLAPKPKPPKLPDLGDRGQTVTQRQAIGHWRFIYGETRVGLHPVYMGSTLTGNDYFHIVGVIASHEVNRIGTIFIDDRPIFTADLDAGGVPVLGHFTNDQHNFPYIRAQTKTGTAAQTAFADLVAESPDWTEDHRCRGHALLYTRHRFNETVYATGLPSPSVVAQGKKVYDTRDGVTRWTPNPALCIRDYLLTAAADGGFGAVAGEFTDSEWSAAANICDEFVNSQTTGDAALIHQVVSVSAGDDHFNLDGDRLKFQTGDRVEATTTGALPTGISAATAYYVIVEQELKDTGGVSRDLRYPRIKLAASYADALARTAVAISDVGSGAHTITKTGEPRYTLNGAFECDVAPRKILEEMLSCCGARLVYAGGKFRLMGLAWEAPTLTLDEDDLRAGIKVQTKRARRDRFNAIKGTYLSPLNDWQASDYPAITSETYEDQDGGIRIFNELDQPYTTRSGQAQRVAKLMLARNRFERVVSYPAKLTAYDTKACEIIAVTNSRWAWSAKPFEVVSRRPAIVDGDGDRPGPYLGVELTLNEASEDAFDWVSTDEQADSPVIPPTLPDYANIPPPGTPVISEYLYEGRDGSDVKAVARMEWAASPSALLTGYETEFWPSSGTEADAVAFATPVSAAITLADRFDILPGSYIFRVRGTTSLGAKTAWATTAAIEIVGLAGVPADLTGLVLQPAGGEARLRWDRHADADVRRGGIIEFRHSPVEDSTDPEESTSIGDAVDGDVTQVNLPLKPGTYFARPSDKLGIPAANWTPVSTAGATALAWTTDGSIVEDSAFPGSTVDCIAVAGSYVTLAGDADIDNWGDVDDVLDWDYEGGVQAAGAYTFSAGIDLGAPLLCRVRSHIRAVVVNAFDDIDDRVENIDDWEDFDGAVAPGAADAWVEFRWTQDDPAGAPVWSDWQRLDSMEIEARAFQFRCQLVSYDAAYTIQVTELRGYAETIV